MKTAIFYHAGCPVCLSAKQQVLDALDKNQFAISVIHLGENISTLADAQLAGVKSVPALVLDGSVFHINFGAALEDLKGEQHA
ncbi:thioredoxin family protein [Pseudoalteromonas caenipelagi]|nr:thioredoxin family protein [Pseudoalteromonas caenipelagi]